jgi:hypothetical protein
MGSLLDLLDAHRDLEPRSRRGKEADFTARDSVRLVTSAATRSRFVKNHHRHVPMHADRELGRELASARQRLGVRQPSAAFATADRSGDSESARGLCPLQIPLKNR